ncbi:class I SAM-dependent methyltransferase [Gramella jeungdoensis]|uniref:Class I SAM-dependent methyltransferase n=1 Tax=Gramella jeungdoensis TaxID=708091 RepID=A0ABT0Z1P2_9FLAO|nr:class I SAM-dependent methyltransferase [Gramella jeungdoensis]MCM8569082.1 class I SAM-dependent methyltransferase [Gramella jeungdoensis]
MSKAEEILKSWEINSAEWIKILDNKAIESRKITNKAIVETIEKHSASKILDLGCGEGWLTRELMDKGFKVTGVDATKALLKEAEKKGKGTFYKLSYEEIESGKNIPNSPFDSVVLNFCLYEKNISGLLLELQNALVKDGKIFIQSIHPYFLIQNDLTYKSKWIEDSWKGLKGNFRNSHSWYARTIEDWHADFKSSDLILENLYEPLNDQNLPASIIFVLKKS